MNKVRFFVTLITALLVTGSFVFAHEVEERHKMKLMFGADAEAIEIEDMEVGETRQFFTEEGKEVVITRGEQGYELTVDGKEINILSPGDHHGASFIDIDGIDVEEGEGLVKVSVKGMVMGEADGEGEANVFVFSGDDEGEHGEHESFTWTEQGGEDAAVSIFVQKSDILSQVLESGVLDQVDEAARDEIIRVIKEAEASEGHHVIRKKIVRVHEEDE